MMNEPPYFARTPTPAPESPRANLSSFDVTIFLYFLTLTTRRLGDIIQSHYMVFRTRYVRELDVFREIIDKYTRIGFLFFNL